MYACFVGGRLVGYYSLSIPSGACELNNLCVLPEYRRRKIGETLLKDAFRAAAERGCGLMKIGIVEENSVLRKWYEGFGFNHTGTRKFDFFPFTCGYMEKNIADEKQDNGTE